MHKIFNSVSEMIGNTPMLKISNITQRLSLKANIFAKCEFYNPFFSNLLGFFAFILANIITTKLYNNF